MTDKNDGVLAVMDAHEFDHKGYCLSCGGWMVSDNGCTPHAHEDGCAFAKAKAAIAELLAAAERVVVADDAQELDGDDIASLKDAIRAMRGDV